MKLYLSAFLLLFIAFFVTSCDEDDASTTETPDVGLDYKPLVEGAWLEYRLDSVIYDDFDNSVTTRSYDLRLEYADEFTDGTAGKIRRVKRFIKPANSTEEYSLETIWFEKIENNRLETYEDNLHFIKLAFAPYEGRTWQGNAFIAAQGNDNPTTSTRYYKDWDYIIESVDQAMTISDQAFDNVLLVNQHDEVGGPGAIQTLVSKEWYAKGVGLVKKQMQMVVENCGEPNCSEKNLPVLDRTKGRKGYSLNMEITDYNIPQ